MRVPSCERSKDNSIRLCATSVWLTLPDRNSESEQRYVCVGCIGLVSRKKGFSGFKFELLAKSFEVCKWIFILFL